MVWKLGCTNSALDGMLVFGCDADTRCIQSDCTGGVPKPSLQYICVFEQERMCDKIVLLSATGRLSIVEFNVDSSRYILFG